MRNEDRGVEVTSSSSMQILHRTSARLGRFLTRTSTRGLLVGCIALASGGVAVAGECVAERALPIVPTDIALCASLEQAVRAPSAQSLDKYEDTLDQFFGNYCHRNEESGWRRDKHMRDTGPFTAQLSQHEWIGKDHGTHAPVVIWYSPEMSQWLTTNRPADGSGPAEPPLVPDGAIMVKEMYPAPTQDCAGVDPLKLYPTNGAAVMIRDLEASHDGWFWGWYGFGPNSGWSPDWPPAASNPSPNMGFAQYCMNCHASAENNLTFSSARNIAGEPGRPLVFLSQGFSNPVTPPSHHAQVALPSDNVRRLGQPHYRADQQVLADLRAYALELPTWDSVSRMPSETYDNVFVAAGGPTAADTFLTSSQCLGCHDAGSTGLQFDMTMPNPHGDDLINMSPYATWRNSPMGLAGRDPIFFAQLASETETFHPDSVALVEDTCLGCHGVTGQRQFHIDSFAESGECKDFTRAMVDAVPYPADNPAASGAKYGMLARDGISCTSCHRMELGPDAQAALANPENACVAERQNFLNPDNTGFAKTFTGSFAVGAPDRIIGPFQDPKVKPMQNAIGNTPEYHASITSSEVCGTCHTVHLPVLDKGKVIGHTYEQTTYPEWAFSAFRTGNTPDGSLPYGPGSDAQSCQDCHMPSRDANGVPYRSKIASIQEYSTFPQADHNLGPEDIDLPIRDGFAMHTLVGLNVFLVKMAQQFPDILGIRTSDPMLGSKGVDPLVRTEQAMLDLASNETAELSVSDVRKSEDTLSATVHVVNKAGHKFPSGVGFRRAFVEFKVLDQLGDTLWASGRTNSAGALIDPAGKPLDGEYWWEDDCSARIDPDARAHQPHFQRITAQDQVQIYQELVAAPPEDETPVCGLDAEPKGALTTSFLSICASVKDNRLLPKGFLPLDERKAIAIAFGAKEDLAIEVTPRAIDNDPDYVQGGGDSLVYEIPLADLPRGRTPAAVQASLYYQATPPFYLQDRMCTSKSDDTKRLKFLAAHLNLDGTQAEGWKLAVTSTGPVSLD